MLRARRQLKGVFMKAPTKGRAAAGTKAAPVPGESLEWREVWVSPWSCRSGPWQQVGRRNVWLWQGLRRQRGFVPLPAGTGALLASWRWSWWLLPPPSSSIEPLVFGFAHFIPLAKEQQLIILIKPNCRISNTVLCFILLGSPLSCTHSPSRCQS